MVQKRILLIFEEQEIYFLWDYLGYSVHVAYYKEKKKQRQKPSSI